MRHAASRLQVPIVATALLAIHFGATPVSAQVLREPGIGAQDARAAIDVTRAPWSSLVRVNTEAGTHCTGAVVGARLVVTAAHCLVAPRTGTLVRAARIHVLVGYDRGAFKTHARVTEITIGPGFDPGERGPAGADWAVLRLDRAAGAAPLALAASGAAGTPAMLGGWQRDRAHALRADTACRIVALVRDASGPLLRHDCDATAGASGGPLLVRQGDGWAIAGIAVLAHRDARGGHAVAADSLALGP